MSQARKNTPDVRSSGVCLGQHRSDLTQIQRVAVERNNAVGSIASKIRALEDTLHRDQVADENDDFPDEHRQLNLGLSSLSTHRAVFTIVEPDIVLVLTIRHLNQDRIPRNDVELSLSPLRHRVAGVAYDLPGCLATCRLLEPDRSDRPIHVLLAQYADSCRPGDCRCSQQLIRHIIAPANVLLLGGYSIAQPGTLRRQRDRKMIDDSPPNRLDCCNKLDVIPV